MAKMTEAERNGREAEMNAYKALRKLNSFFIRRGWALHNLYLPTKGTGTTELDLAFVSDRGVFAIECKNLSGTFYGDGRDREWRNIKVWGKDRNREERTLYNPILQNRTHIDSLRKVLGDDVPFHSVILFSDRADYSNLTVSDDILLLSLSEVKSKLGRKIRGMKRAMGRRDAKKLYKALKPYGKVSRKKMKEHLDLVEHIEEHPDTCPLCGRKLEMKTIRAKDGELRKFLGCSGYPECTYTRNV